MDKGRMWEEISRKLQNIGKDRFVLILLAGLMLVIIAMPVKKGEESESEPTENPQAEMTATEMEGSDGDYREELCRQLKTFLQQMEGVGRAEVYITMHSTGELIVERNSPYKKRTEEEAGDGQERTVGEVENDSQVVLLEQSDGSQAPIVVKEISPMVEGVVVAAQGGDRETIKTEITELVMALFGIEEHKIKVVKLST